MRLDVARGVGPLAHSYPGQPYARVPLTPTSNPSETSPEIKLWWWGGGGGGGGVLTGRVNCAAVQLFTGCGGGGGGPGGGPTFMQL